MSRILVFDSNHLLYRAYYKFTNLKTIEGTKTSIIYGVIYILESLIRRLDGDKIIAVFDGDKSKYRLSLLPEYKQREKKLGWDAENFFFQRDEVIKMIMALGIKVSRRQDLEADDVIALITKRLKKTSEIIIVSGDKDFNQLIEESVSVFNSTKGVMLTKANLQKLLGYKPKQTVDYLSLLGDSSDKIPGYNGIGEKKALNLLDTYGSIKKFIKSGEPFGKVDLEKLKALTRLNKKLIDLKYFYRKFLKHDEIPYLNPNPIQDMDKFGLLCKKYETNSFLKTQFIKTFKNLNHDK